MGIKKWLSGLMDIRQRRQYSRYRQKYEIDQSFTFNGPGTMLYGDGRIVLEADSYIGRYGSIHSTKGFSVQVGRHCQISHFVKIYTSSGLADQDFSQPERELRQGSVIIGDYCWIGAGVFIREGVTIGENAVVGANSVVVRDIPGYSIYGGVPAKLIKYKKCRPGGLEL